jgi:Holliday junction resolvasome RuvABC endonuclease subunit
MTAILAIDLGTHCGYALGSTEGANEHTGPVPLMLRGSWNLKPGKFDGGGMRAVRFKNELDKLMRAIPFERVVFEAVRAHKGVDAAHVYGGLMMTLQAWCETQEPPIPYEGVGVGAIKKFATGKGNASKGEMLAAVERLGFPTDDDNEADAVALLLLALTGGRS